MTRTGWTWVCLTACLVAMATAQDRQVEGCHGAGYLTLTCPADTQIAVSDITYVINRNTAEALDCDVPPEDILIPGMFRECSVQEGDQLHKVRTDCDNQTSCLSQYSSSYCDAYLHIGSTRYRKLSTHFIVGYTCQDVSTVAPSSAESRATGEGTTYSSQGVSDADTAGNQSHIKTVYLVAGPLAGVVVILLVVLLVCLWRQKKKKNEVKQGQAGLDTLARVKTDKDTDAYHSRAEVNPYESMPAAAWDIPAYTVICTESGKPRRDSGCDSLSENYEEAGELTVNSGGYSPFIVPQADGKV